ncbi:hypothetical protein [Geitlerinema sp. PCC 9228]|uniref:hypothetical protein n=1 Tax=Geitlerinema sp. PCC 9228 TaxID=111611 RepID=UPI00147F14C8|nr:hypothetical protein [Geitlerinema sp. PCC 9228]
MATRTNQITGDELTLWLMMVRLLQPLFVNYVIGKCQSSYLGVRRQPQARQLQH